MLFLRIYYNFSLYLIPFASHEEKQLNVSSHCPLLEYSDITHFINVLHSQQQQTKQSMSVILILSGHVVT